MLEGPLNYPVEYDIDCSCSYACNHHARLGSYKATKLMRGFNWLSSIVDDLVHPAVPDRSHPH